MTLVSTRTGVVGLISKIAEQDEAAAGLLLRMSVFGAMCEVADADETARQDDVRRLVAKRSVEGRRALVRSYIDKRAAGDDVEDVLEAARVLTTVELSKAAGQKDKQGHFHDRVGRFTSGADHAAAGLGAMSGSRSASTQALGAVLTASGQSSVGGAVVAAGKLGPEAERVLGPHLQRAAYRYRGTERRPSEALLDAKERYAVTGGARPGSPIAGIVPYYDGPAGQGMSQGSKQLAVNGDSAAAYFRSQLPSQQQAELSLASGRVPPSRGAIIDADGDVITEAVGMNGDHYVPFDLKNLARMEGGQYVRTRAAGGPTREDLYTGLMSGARQVQVVSHSGVFTIELDPSLRGGRRYSDKSRSMINRYQELLATVESGAVAEVGLGEYEKTALRARALARADNDPGKAKTIYRELEQKAIATQSFTRGDGPGELEEAAENKVATFERQQGRPYGASERRKIVADVTNDLRQKGMDTTPRSLKLDGEGYRRAMDSLASEYPYFVKDVRYETLRDFETSRGLRGTAKQPGRGPVDSGFVQRGNVLAATSKDKDLGARARGKKRATRDAASEETTTQDETNSEPRTAAAAADRAPATPGIPEIKPELPMPGAPGAVETVRGNSEFFVEEQADAVLGMQDAVQQVHGEDLKVVADSGERMHGSAYLDWYFNTKHSGAQRAIAKHLMSTATPEERHKVLTELNTLQKQIGRLSSAQQDNYAAADDGIRSMTKLLSAMESGQPYSQAKAMDLVQDDSSPFAYPEVARLGMVKANLDAFEVTAGAADDDMGSNLRTHKTAKSAKEAVKQGALQAARLEKYIKPAGAGLDPGAATDPEEAKDTLARLKTQIPKLHLTWSFRQTQENARALAELQGQDFEGEQSHPLEPALETVSARDPRAGRVAKRRVTWHPPGSPRAVELAKRRAAQAGSPTRLR